MTLEEAVEYLSLDTSHQLCGASFIQDHTFKEDEAKQEVSKLKFQSELNLPTAASLGARV